MPIPLPNLDDRGFTDLMHEVRALIPRYAPVWTNHNASDPGITLLELFAWLTEAMIYRINRSTDVSEARFLELLGASFSPARPASITLLIVAQGLGREKAILRGTALLADRADGRPPLSFETGHDVLLKRQLREGSEFFEARVSCVQVTRIEKEKVGTSDGTAFQHFSLATPHIVPNIAVDLPAELAVMVDSVPWTFRETLLDSGPDDTHFTVDARMNRIQFGGGSGMIPPHGAEILVTYQATQGEIGELAAETQFQFVHDLSMEPAITLEGRLVDGSHPTGLDEARRFAIDALRTKNRAITSDDFESLLLGHADYKLARAKCVPGWDLTAQEDRQVRADHASIIVVPDKQDERPMPTAEEVDRIYEFLDERRLITCRHHVVGPTYLDIKVETEIVTNKQRPNTQVIADLAANLKAFFHPLTGGPGDGAIGWPFGRDVHLSEVFEVIENSPGVDHAEAAALKSRDITGEWQEAGERIELMQQGLVSLVIDTHADIRIREQY